jgi:hypothetical protein
MCSCKWIPFSEAVDKETTAVFVEFVVSAAPRVSRNVFHVPSIVDTKHPPNHLHFCNAPAYTTVFMCNICMQD